MLYSLMQPVGCWPLAEAIEKLNYGMSDKVCRTIKNLKIKVTKLMTFYIIFRSMQQSRYFNGKQCGNHVSGV